MQYPIGLSNVECQQLAALSMPNYGGQPIYLSHDHFYNQQVVDGLVEKGLVEVVGDASYPSHAFYQCTPLGIKVLEKFLG